MQFSTVSDYTHLFGPKCLPQHPLLSLYSQRRDMPKNRQVRSSSCVNLLFVDVKREGRI